MAPFKMYGKSPMMKKLIGKQHNLPEALKAKIEASPMAQKKKEKELPKKVTAEGYGIQNVSKIQEDKKGLFMTGLRKDFANQEGTSDTTYIPKGMKHYSGKTYKKGDYMDETDFEEMFKKKK